MPTRRQKIQAKALEIADPITRELGMELIDAEFTHRGREQVLCLYIDRPGGISIDDLQEASRSVEKALEVSEIISGKYRLEVSSPGIDRPLKNPSDYRKKIGQRIRIRTFSPLPDGSRTVRGTLHQIAEDRIRLEDDGGGAHTLALEEIASARPEPDWEELLKKPAGRQKKDPRGRRSR